MHQDNYENLYLVTSGTKVFWLTPPSAISCLYEAKYAPATYAITENGEKWTIKRTDKEDDSKQTKTNNSTTSVPWIPIDLSLSDQEVLERWPRFKNSGMKEVHVGKNEMLYLPSLWYHGATQVEETVAINCWWDMKFDHRWCYQQYLRDSLNSGGGS